MWFLSVMESLRAGVTGFTETWYENFRCPCDHLAEAKQRLTWRAGSELISSDLVLGDFFADLFIGGSGRH
jgi:hypothetical protein